MGTYRVEWDCCGSVTETEAWEPESCPFCTDAAPPAAPMPEPVGKVLAEGEMIGYDRRGGDVIWWNKPPGPAMLYAAPPAAPEECDMADTGWTSLFQQCHFAGPPPAHHTNWNSWGHSRPLTGVTISAAPVVREPLTGDQIADCTIAAHAACDAKGVMTRWSTEFARAIERAHGIGGGNG